MIAIVRMLKWFLSGVFSAGFALGVAVTHWYRADRLGFEHEALLTGTGIVAGAIFTHVIKRRAA